MATNANNMLHTWKGGHRGKVKVRMSGMLTQHGEKRNQITDSLQSTTVLTGFQLPSLAERLNYAFDADEDKCLQMRDRPHQATSSYSSK